MSRPVAFAAAILLASTTALAAGDEHGDSATSDFLWQTANFILLVGVLVWLLRKPMQKFFADRREEIAGNLENASQLLQQAESRFAEWQGKLADLDQELEQLRAVAQRRAQEERNQILADARSTAERIERDAGAAVDQEIRRARTVLREEAADLAVELAAELLREQVGDDDRERLIDEFIARVDEVEKSGARGSAEDEAGR